MSDIRYSQATRRAYIQVNLERYENQGASYRDIAWDVKAQFGLDRPPSPATIGQDLSYLRNQTMQVELSEEALRLLEPENFGEWRRTLFTAPGGEQYDTPEHQMALFWMIHSLALKVAPPDWVVEYFGFSPEDIADIESMEKLLTFILLVAPRHGKTELVMHALIWLMLYNPNIRIIYVQGVAKTAVRIMKHIQWELEHNAELVRLYGPFKDDDVTWNSEEFTLATRTVANKSPTFLPSGIVSNLRSLDADIIVVDDPQDLKRVKSETVAQNDFEQVTTELMTRREKHTPVFGIGSHLPVVWGDLWSKLEDSQEELNTTGQVIHIRKIAAHDTEVCTGNHDDPEPKCVLWPKVRPWWFLEAQKALLDKVVPGLFDVVFNQKDRAAGLQLFQAEVLEAPYWVPEEDTKDDKGKYPAPPAVDDQVWGILDYTRSWKEWPSCCGQIVAGLGFDPAASERSDGSESALVIRAGCARCGRRFLIDYWHKHQSPERNPDTIDQYVASYRSLGLSRVRIEVNAYQKSLARDPRIKEMKRNRKVHVDEWRTDDRKNDPALGVPNMATYQNDGMLSVPAKTLADRAFGDAYIRAYKRYPAKPNDIPMADWLAELEVAAALDALNNQGPEDLPGRENLPEYLQDDVVEFDLSELFYEDVIVF